MDAIVNNDFGLIHEDSHRKIFCGDARFMSALSDNSVQMGCTSPPYWGLRKYAGEQDLVWGGKVDCKHEWCAVDKAFHSGQVPDNKWKNQSSVSEAGNVKMGSFCSLCGAWLGQFGLEPTPEMYVEHTVEILREVKRVLRPDGVVFWNIGDSYSGGHRKANPKQSISGEAETGHEIDYTPSRDIYHPFIKPKDLCLIPFRVAIAAQNDGWWVRSVIIWSKINPMPESVTDRPTEAHEYILMLTKSGTSQYWTHRDGNGTRDRPKADWRWVSRLTNEEVVTEPSDWRIPLACPVCEGSGSEVVNLGLDVLQGRECIECKGKGSVKTWKRINLWRGHDYYWDADAVREKAQNWGTRERSHNKYREAGLANGLEEDTNPSGRNIRSVWEFPTQPYPEAHFAVFPEKLPEICIKAATPEVGCCSKCGAPWERITEDTPMKIRRTDWGEKAGNRTATSGTMLEPAHSETTGWQPTCKCNADKVPSIVLDPFMGSGTTLEVAAELNRKAVGYDLSSKYCVMSAKRNIQSVIGVGGGDYEEMERIDGIPKWMLL